MGSEPRHDRVFVSRQEHHCMEAPTWGGAVRLPSQIAHGTLALRVRGGHLLRRTVRPVSTVLL